jgi:hypothetical protein
MVIQIIDNPEKTDNPYAKAILGAGQGYMNAQQNQKEKMMEELQNQMKMQQEEKLQQQRFGFVKQMQQEKFGNESSKNDKDFLNQLELEDKKHDHAKELQGLKPKSKEELERESLDKVKENGQKAWNNSVRLLKGKNLGRLSNAWGFFGGQTGRDIGEFQSTMGALESMLVHFINPSGSMSDTRFKYITENLLPKYDDSDAVIEGKLIGLAKILGFDDSELTKGKKKGTPISDKVNEKMGLEDIW